MRTLKTAPALLLLLTATAQAATTKAPPLPSAPPPIYDQTPVPVSAGTYTDSAGTPHRWQVLPSHTLSWDGQPYLPVGVRFVPQAWKVNSTPADADADNAALSTLKAHGVFDVTLAAPAPLLRVPSATVQKTLDTLDANGFHYGLELSAFPTDPVPVTIVKPGAYRNPSPPAQGPARFGPVPGLVGARYLLVSSHDGTIDESGAAQIDGTTASVTLKTAPSDDVLLLYPQRLLSSDAPEGRMPDLWQNYDAYRDSLLAFLRPLRFGPGLRFFLDPLGKQMAFGGEWDSALPDTDGWRLDFAAWLGKRYARNTDDLNRGWGIENRDLPSFVVAARCLPLWYEARGVPALLDPVTNTRYAVLNKPRIGGHVWEDIAAFRTQSAQSYMNTAAAALKSSAADVPVLYRWTGRAPLWTQTDTSEGWDGLYVESAVFGQAPMQTNAALALSQAEDAAKTEWLVVGGAAVTDNASSVLASWDAARQVGARGFYASAAVPAALDTLNSFAAGLQVSASAIAQARVLVLPYPDGAGLDLTPQRLPSGVWWLPSARPGAGVALGPTLSAYYLPDPAGRLPTYVLWSPRPAPQGAQFPLGKKSFAQVWDAGGNPLNVQKKGDTWTLPVGPQPLLVSRVASMPLPLNAEDAVVAEARRLIALAEQQHIDVQQSRDQLFYAVNTVPDADSNVDLRYGLVQRVIDGLTAILRPYTWVEGERAAAYTFDSLSPDPAASGGAFLSLDTMLAPPNGDGYSATYRVSVNAPGRYALWLAGTPLDGKVSSPFTFRMDDGVPRPVSAVPSVGGLYAGRFVWSNLGDVTLTRGTHMLTFTVSEPRLSDGRYKLAIDVLCLSRTPFTPDGTRPPRIDLPPPPPDVPAPRKGRR